MPLESMPTFSDTVDHSQATEQEHHPIFKDTSPGSSAYAPLRNPRSTRLVSIRSFDPMSPVKAICELKTVDFDHACPAYTALSYVWSAPENTPESQAAFGQADSAVIELVGEDASTEHKTISETLYGALKQLWSRMKHEYIWADQICINQNDLAERASQVNLMGEIYARAESVTIWTGEDSAESPMFDAIVELANKTLAKARKHLEETGAFPAALVTGGPDAHLQELMYRDGLGDTLSCKPVISLQRFLSYRRYFGRAWIVQELTLARRPSFMLGGLTIAGSDLDDLAKWMRESLTLITQGWRLDRRYMEAGIQGLEMHQCTALRRVIEHGGIRHLPVLTMLQELFGAHDELTLASACLEWLVMMTMSRTASHPGDKIFSLIGLLKRFTDYDTSIIVSPDYSRSIQHVYTSFATQQLMNLPYLTVLSLVCDPTERKVSDLPSWVPDLSGRLVGEKLLAHTKLARNAMAEGNGTRTLNASLCSASQSQDPVSRVIGAELHLQGRRCSALKTCFDMQGTNSNSNMSKIFAYWRRLVRWVLHTCRASASTYPTGIPVTEAMMRTLLRGEVDDDRLSEHMNELEALVRFCVSEGLVNPIVYEDEIQMMDDVAALHRRKVPSVPDPHDNMLQHALKTFEKTSRDLTSRKHDAQSADLPGLHMTLDTMGKLYCACLPPASFDNPDELRKHMLVWKWSANGFSYDLFSVEERETIHALVKAERKMLEEVGQHFLTLSNLHNAFVTKLQSADSYAVPFTTANGYFGSSTQSIRPGDEIWLISQARVPFVLRPREDGRFEIIHEAYVQGAMYGELIKDGVAGEEQDIVIV